MNNFKAVADNTFPKKLIKIKNRQCEAISLVGHELTQSESTLTSDHRRIALDAATDSHLSNQINRIEKVIQAKLIRKSMIANMEQQLSS